MAASVSGPVLVAAFGNRDAGDDAFGGRVVERLAQEEGAAIQILDLTREHPTALLDHLVAAPGLIVVDAVSAPGMRAGALVDVDWHADGRPDLVHGGALSSHGLSVGNQLELAQRLGLLPLRIRVIGLAVGDAGVGAPSSDHLAQGVEEAVKMIRYWVRRWA